MDRTQLAHAYRLISELFLYPEDRDSTRIEAATEWLATAPTEFQVPLKAFLAAPGATSSEEYVATLELTPAVPLYFGSYLFGEPKSCRGAGLSGRNGYMLELANIYRYFGVELAGRELADFVPVVVEFLAISLDRIDQDRIGLRRYFIETLLINGIESLLSALRKYESPYVHLVEALRVALAEDIARMAGGRKWQPPADDGERQPSVAALDSTVNGRATPENWVEL